MAITDSSAGGDAVGMIHGGTLGRGDASKRPRKRLLLVLVCLATALAAGASLSVLLEARMPVEASPNAAAQYRPASSRYFQTVVVPEGVVLSTKATFADDLTLTDPALRVGDVEAEGELLPVDGRDHEGDDVHSVALPSGTAVNIHGLIRPQCDGHEPDAIISVTSEDAAGERVVHHYEAHNSRDLVSAVRMYCRQGPTVTARMETISPSGNATIAVTIANPGPEAITVEAPAYSDEHVTWSALSGTVAAGETKGFKIEGTKVGCEPGEIASWQDGRLLVDGKPMIVRSQDAWC